MRLSPSDFLSGSNPQLEEKIGRNRYILVSDLLPLLSLAHGQVSIPLGAHSLEKQGVRSVVFEDSFFSSLFQCPPPSQNSGCTCCSPIRGVSLYGLDPAYLAEKPVSHPIIIGGVAHELSMFKGSCPLFAGGCCSLGGSAEKFYHSVPLPCAISPGWNVRLRGNSAFVGRKFCKHGEKVRYSENKLRDDSVVLERIADFLRSLSLEPAFSIDGFRRSFEAQLL